MTKEQRKAQRNAYMKEYRSRPENHAKYLAYQREYSHRPEVKARRQERDRNSSRRMAKLLRTFKKHGLDLLKKNMAQNSVQE